MDKIAVKGCPPELGEIEKAFEQAGIPMEKSIAENVDLVPGFFMEKVKGNSRFDGAFFRVDLPGVLPEVRSDGNPG